MARDEAPHYVRVIVTAHTRHTIWPVGYSKYFGESIVGFPMAYFIQSNYLSFRI